MHRMLHVDPEAFLIDTIKLGRLVYRTGFRPRHAISLWRGGTPVGLGVDAYFRSRGLFINHTTVATDSYTGIGQQAEVTVKNLEHLIQVICPEDGLLIIDDVYESGRTIAKIVELLRHRARANAPQDIRVATVHRKPGRATYLELPVYALRDVDDNTWIDYPHELADLVSEGDPDDSLIRSKDEKMWTILRGGPIDPVEVPSSGRGYVYAHPRELLLDCVQLGVNVSRDARWHPSFMIALWPGGVLAGLPVHEVYKYHLRKTESERPAPDHISVNTSPTRSSFRSSIVGLTYLEERINQHDNVLIIDTTFRAGRLVNDVIARLKEVLRRNLSHEHIRVASVYHNPEDQSTWTVRPDIRKPYYYLKRVHEEVIYPASVHKLPDARQDLRQLSPTLATVLYDDD